MKWYEYVIIGVIVVVAIHFASHAGRQRIHAPGRNDRSGGRGPAPTASGGGGQSSGRQPSCG